MKMNLALSQQMTEAPALKANALQYELHRPDLNETLYPWSSW